MTRESEFIFYRERITLYNGVLENIYRLAKNLKSIDITLPHLVRANPFSFYCNDRSDEWELNEGLSQHLERPIVPLFDELTLMLLSESGEVHGDSSGSGVEGRNAVYSLNSMMEKSAGYTPHRINTASPLSLGHSGELSFDGFTNEEAGRFVASSRRMAEDRLERIRDINTRVKALKGIRLDLHPKLGGIKAAPVELRGTWHDGSLKDEIPLFSLFWLTRALGEIGFEIMSAVEKIEEFSSPTGDEPKTLDYHSSNTNNRHPIVYVEDEAT